MVGEWIEWEGGECPVDDMATVNWRILNEKRDWSKHDIQGAKAFTLDWDHQGTGSDIVAYRVPA